MIIYQIAAWGVIVSLSLMMIGGLVLWAYSAHPQPVNLAITGPEDEAAKQFHQRRTRWFFIYGVTMIVAGTGLLFWAGSYFI